MCSKRGNLFPSLVVNPKAEYSPNNPVVLFAPPRAARPPPGPAPCGMAGSRCQLRYSGGVSAKIGPRREMTATAQRDPDAPPAPQSISRGLMPHGRHARRCCQRSAPGAGAEFPKRNVRPYPDERKSAEMCAQQKL